MVSSFCITLGHLFNDGNNTLNPYCVKRCILFPIKRSVSLKALTRKIFGNRIY